MGAVGQLGVDELAYEVTGIEWPEILRALMREELLLWGGSIPTIPIGHGVRLRQPGDVEYAVAETASMGRVPGVVETRTSRQ